MEDLRQSYKRRHMYQVVMSYIRSSQSQEEFCRENNMSLSKLHYWYHKYKQESQDKELLVPLQVDDVPDVKQLDEVKICFPNGVVVQVLSSEPENILRSLLLQI